jgi:sigma-E factor negative regulatory protein RseB
MFVSLALSQTDPFVKKTISARRAAVLLILCAAVPGSAPAQKFDATQLMRRMTSATEKLGYDGVFIYQRGAQIDAMRIVHRFDGEGERERLVSLSGPEREVIRDGRRVTCLFADDREVMVEKSEPRDFLSLGLGEPVEQLSAHYSFEVAGQDRVAGRATTVITILPKEHNRYGYQLWIDDEFGLLLRSVILSRLGRALEQVQFVQISISEELPDSAFETDIEGAGFTWYTNSDADDSTATVRRGSGWSVKWLPAGFQMRNHKIQTMSQSDMPVSHMVYSDGLAMVSVFVEELMDSSEPLQGFSSMGAVNAFSRVAENHQITVVGEVPLPTVRQIAGSVEQN